MIVRTHSDFIVLSHRETRLLATYPNMQLTHIILTLDAAVESVERRPPVQEMGVQFPVESNQ